MQNNLFYYATKELSQDAFICWLMSFARKNSKKDDGLRECARDFIKQFTRDESGAELWVTNIQRQYKSIDVLIEVNYKYLILIEDKTHTDEHDDQLARYRTLLETDFPDRQLFCVYWKNGFQSDMSSVIENNYLPFGRNDILSTLEKYVSRTDNQIFIDYYEYVKNMQKEVSLFRSIPIPQWNWLQINGFYDYLKQNPGIIGDSFKANYGYVANPSGGFFGMWFGNGTFKTIDDDRYELYLQMEFVEGHLRICYKASAYENENKIDSSICNSLLGIYEGTNWINVAEKHNFNRPVKFGCGKTVTLGVFDADPVSYDEAIECIKESEQSFSEIIKELR